MEQIKILSAPHPQGVIVLIHRDLTDSMPFAPPETARPVVPRLGAIAAVICGVGLLLLVIGLRSQTEASPATRILGVGEIVVAQPTEDRHVVSVGTPAQTSIANLTVVDADGAAVATHAVTNPGTATSHVVTDLDPANYHVIVEWETPIEESSEGVMISAAAVAIAPETTLQEGDVLVLETLQATPVLFGGR